MLYTCGKVGGVLGKVGESAVFEETAETISSAAVSMRHIFRFFEGLSKLSA
jgi:hypothetical protein